MFVNALSYCRFRGSLEIWKTTWISTLGKYEQWSLLFTFSWSLTWALVFGFSTIVMVKRKSLHLSTAWCINHPRAELCNVSMFLLCHALIQPFVIIYMNVPKLALFSHAGRERGKFAFKLLVGRSVKVTHSLSVYYLLVIKLSNIPRTNVLQICAWIKTAGIEWSQFKYVPIAG